MTSLKDISAICHVSVTTVSKALNGRKDVGRKTRERILRTARELHYTAKGGEEIDQETHRCTMNLGILMPAMIILSDRDTGAGSRLHLTGQEIRIIHAFFETAMQEGFDITILNVDDRAAYQMSYLARCRYRQLDGVFILRRGEEMFEKRVMELLRDDLPVVTLDQAADYKQVPLSDAAMVGRSAAVKLITSVKGIRRMADYTPHDKGR